jgi:CBS domain-containing protein
MPVTKVYTLFSSMGLRHLVVLGGESGGEVVGIVSRSNLLPEHIYTRTGL